MNHLQQTDNKQLLNKVPEITLYFWVIKILCTTVGETAADYLNADMQLGLSGTTLFMSVLLLAFLVMQLRSKRYIAWLYWIVVALISIVGTLITDNLVDNLGVALETTTITFGIALLITFIAWYKSAGTLSIHTIFNRKRELYYWTAILFTFALGTAAGDLAAEGLALGYANSLMIFSGLIGVVSLFHFRFKANAILTFWIAYILTRPLGASLGDYLSQASSDGGLGLGAGTTNLVFLSAIVSLVIYLTLAKPDVKELA